MEINWAVPDEDPTPDVLLALDGLRVHVEAVRVAVASFMSYAENNVIPDAEPVLAEVLVPLGNLFSDDGLADVLAVLGRIGEARDGLVSA